MWCQTCHLIYAVGYDDDIGNCRNCKNHPKKFQDILKHLDVNAKFENQEREEANKEYEIFIKDCIGIVER